MRLLYKLWLDYRGRAFGDGPARLLDGVERSGSLRKAAHELGMSYNKAWRILHAAEQRLGFPLLDRSVGGSSGGGSQLTPEGKDLLRRYRALSGEVAALLEAAFARHFGDWEDPAGGSGSLASPTESSGSQPQASGSADSPSPLARSSGTPPSTKE